MGEFILLLAILMYEMVLDKEIFYYPNLYKWSEYVIKWTLYTVKYREICMYDLGHKKRQERGICRKVNMVKRKFHKSSLDVKIQLFNHIVWMFIVFICGLIVNYRL